MACYLDLLPQDEIPWHWHNELELGIVIRGDAVINIGSDQYGLHAGDAFFINSNILHTVISSGDSVCEIHTVVCHPRAVSGSTDKISVIAENCGFQEMSYFAKSFKEVYGCTPSEYRIGK